MKRLAVVALLALELTVGGCGGTRSIAQGTASGTWQAVLTGGTGDAATLDFVTTFTVRPDNSLDISGIEFLTSAACFMSAASASGTLDATTNSDNVVTGNLSYTVLSGTPAGNSLTLTGTENGNVITGTWSLAGGAGSADCTGTGQFTMCEGNGTCTPTTK